MTDKAAPRTLYVRRDVKNSKDIISWAKGQGFKTTLPADELHVTIMYSKSPVDWMKMGQDFSMDSKGEITIQEGGARLVEPLGTEGAVVLMFSSTTLSWRHQDMKNNGASFDWPEYQPHITISYEAGDLDLKKVEPYRGKIVLGPEVFEEVKEDWMDNVEEKSALKFNVAKVDKKLGVVFGWGIVCKKDGKDYYDLQEDHITEKAMLEAAIDFAENSRVSKEMHDGDETPNSMFVFPLTEEIAKGFGITTAQTGLMVMYKPGPDALAKFESGHYTGFSIGGEVVQHEVGNG